MISVITVNYRTERYLKELLALLGREDLVEEIIVMNNSPEPLPFNPEDSIQKRIRLIQNEENLGLAKAVNRAAEMATCPHLLLINPDVVPLEDSISILYKTAKRWSAPISGPRFFWDEGKIFRLPPAEGTSLFWQSALAAAHAYPVDERLVSFYWQIRFDRFWNARDPIYEPFLGGACLLVNAQMLDRKELLDERFFLYHEETDLCYESIKDDLRVLCVPQAEMIHHWGMSPSPSKSKPDLRAASAKIFMEKHYPGIAVTDFPKRETHRSEIFELHDPEPPILFDIPDVADMALHIEIGVNPLFIPFAQARATGDATFALPEEIWLKMEPREYFVRIRGSLSGTLRTWKFHKNP